MSYLRANVKITLIKEANIRLYFQIFQLFHPVVEEVAASLLSVKIDCYIALLLKLTIYNIYNTIQYNTIQYCSLTDCNRLFLTKLPRQDPEITDETNGKHKKKCNSRIRDLEDGSFTPLAFSSNGEMSQDTKIFYSRLSELVSKKHTLTFSTIAVQHG